MSTVSQVLGGALVKLGLTRRVRSTPLCIVLAALSHCGAIELDSTPGRGTTARIVLPLNAAAAGLEPREAALR